MTKPDNRLVAKNALLLTIRMIIVTIAGLYTSRIVFQQLGDTNYGVYGVVGGILGLMSFLTSSMAGASSRFITYEIGRGDSRRINEIFNTSFAIHCVIALLVIVIGETLGLWFLYNVLVIPADRLYAAFWVFQFSIVSSAVSITQVPYTAVIIANEKMGVYAYMELINTGLKLLIAYLLCISPFDKLIVYSFLLLTVSFLTAMFYRVYCMRKYRDYCRLSRPRDRNAVKSLLSFSAMDLYGNLGVTANTQGLVYAVNIYFGVIYNAAVNLATTAGMIIMSLSSAIATAFKPQIIKQYAGKNVAAMQTMMENSLKFTLTATAVVSVPCIFEAQFAMTLWLGEIPPYSVEFLRVIIIQNFIVIINNICNTAIHANGDIKALTFINGTILMIMPAAVFVIYHCGGSVLWGYGVEIIGLILIVAIAILIIKRLIPEFNLASYIGNLTKCVMTIAICAAPVGVIHCFMAPGFLRAVTIALSYSLLLAVLSWLIVLSKDNRVSLRTGFKLRGCRS